MLVDLAGSERAADSKDHTSERLAETKGSFSFYDYNFITFTFINIMHFIY